MNRIDTIVIGAGHAGVAASHELKARGIDHIVLERDRIAEAWRKRWDSFCLVTPNWTVNLPGFPYAGNDPDGFMARDAIVDHLMRYAAIIDAPVQEHTAVDSVRRLPNGSFELDAGGEKWACSSLVVATGAYQKPYRPAAAATVPDAVLQLDALGYSRPEDLPDGGVLVVGSGQSGCQIAHELAKAGRTVFLSCGRAPWVPRRIGGRDMAHWIAASGMLDTPASEVSPEARFAANAMSTGQAGGHDLNYRVLREAGVTLTGHFAGSTNQTLVFDDDLSESIAWSDAAHEKFQAGMLKFAKAAGWPDPEFPDVAPFNPEQPATMDTASVGAVIYATGYRPAYSDWLPWDDAFDNQGFPIQSDGVSRLIPGLFFLGTHLLRKRKSSLLAGIAEDASIVADAVATSRTISGAA